ncbi:unnamed protein product [Moneuplotes crassus]|uniref:Glutaredoxin domain-containing protein n=1 Tax=Euplotes crassus TaxID=5936 RepID=A0AAD2D9B3_EUPCR|nr:unnamed protein product [Moneuplotes crassus]
MAVVPICREKYYEILQKKMMEKPVFVVSTNTCPYCVKAKTLLDNNKVEATEFNLDEFSDEDRVEFGHCIWGALPRRFVPFIYVNKQPLGSYSELVQAQEEGMLKNLASGATDDIL